MFGDSAAAAPSIVQLIIKAAMGRMLSNYLKSIHYWKYKS